MKRTLLLIASLLILCGCRGGYIGGLDDSNIQYGQLVMINRSSHEVSMKFLLSGRDSVYTVNLEPYDGLWKLTQKDMVYNFSFDWAELRFDDKRTFCFDSWASLPYNPCFGTGTTNVYDSNGNYYVYDISDKSYEDIMNVWEELQTFEMFSLTPSYIIDSLCIEGSSEAIFKRLYPAGDVKNHLKIGAAVKTEAERIDLIGFDSSHDIDPEETDISEDFYLAPYEQIKAYYYGVEDLRKMGLAHFGCDFASLTGRKDKEMDRFCGVMAVNAHVETCEFVAGQTFEPTEDLSFVDEIYHGQLMILLAESDCSAENLEHYVERNLLMGISNRDFDGKGIDFHLITINDKGKFQCTTGGKELVDIYMNGVEDQPVFPIAFSLCGGSGIHIPDITF